MPPWVTAVRSERGRGSRPVTIGLPGVVAARALAAGPVTCCTVATLACSPPPNTNVRPPTVAPAASCVGTARRLIRVVLPVAGLRRRTVAVEVPWTVSPPTMSRSGLWGRTTSRDSPDGS